MWDVYEKYRMPIVKLPNAEAFIAAVLSTGIDSARAVITDVLNPTYASLGLESRAAVKRAAARAGTSPKGQSSRSATNPRLHHRRRRSVQDEP